jgi:hypothetical protein
MVDKGSNGSTFEQDFWLDTPSLHKISIPVNTLDLWLEQSAISISSHSLIKIDVETHEPKVFHGAEKSLAAGPAVLCEVLGTFTEQRLLNEIFPNSHWHYFWIGPVERRRIIGDPGWEFLNYLFIPNGNPFECVLKMYS